MDGKQLMRLVIAMALMMLLFGIGMMILPNM